MDPRIHYNTHLISKISNKVLRIKDILMRIRIFCFCFFCFEGTFTLFSGSIAGSGSLPLTIGSGSGRPKNFWIHRIRIGIRIRNTDIITGSWRETNAALLGVFQAVLWKRNYSDIWKGYGCGSGSGSGSTTLFPSKPVLSGPRRTHLFTIVYF